MTEVSQDERIDRAIQQLTRAIVKYPLAAPAGASSRSIPRVTSSQAVRSRAARSDCAS